MKTLIDTIKESQSTNKFSDLYSTIENTVAKFGGNDEIDKMVATFKQKINKKSDPNEPRFLIKDGSGYTWNRFRHLPGNSEELKNMHYKPVGIIFGESFLRINEKTYDELYKEFKTFFEKYGDGKKLK